MARYRRLWTTALPDPPPPLTGGDLRAFRILRGWTQEEMAVYLGTDRRNLQRWERERTRQRLPGPMARLIYWSPRPPLGG